MKHSDFNWTKTPIVGMALLMKGGSIDSNNDPINPMAHYNVGKNKFTGKVIISKIL